MKKLIINPSRDAKVTMVKTKDLLPRLTSKVFRSAPNEFKPMEVKDHHVRVFISNVEYSGKAIGGFTGKQLNNFDEAMAYLNQVGAELYGKNWLTKELRKEIQDLPKEGTYGIKTSMGQDDLVAAIKKELDGIAIVETNAPRTEKKKEKEESNE